MLIALLIGNNLVNIGASAFATVVATEHLGALGPGVAVGVLTFLILVFGEITPKSLAIRHSVGISLSIAPIVQLLMRALYPLVWLFEHLINFVYKLTDIKEAPSVTESELVGLLMRGAQEGIFEKDEAKIIERVFAFNDLLVADVMTGRHKIFALNEELSINEALPKIVETGFSRIPVFRVRLKTSPALSIGTISPLPSAGKNGAAVEGVRYRAASSCRLTSRSIACSTICSVRNGTSPSW